MQAVRLLRVDLLADLDREDRPRRARVAHDDLAQWSVSLAKAILLMSFHYTFLMIVTNSKTHFLSNILYYHCLKAFLLLLTKVMS